jgi:hypothetical protein
MRFDPRCPGLTRYFKILNAIILKTILNPIILKSARTRIGIAANMSAGLVSTSSARSSEHATMLGQKSADGAFALVCRQAGPNFAEQPLHIDRLGIEIGTSDLDALVAIAGQRVGRQRNDWNC